jgi:hypothetical protein
MKQRTLWMFTLLFLGIDVSAQLSTRGPEMIYDRILEVTWLRDANLALTNQFGVSGINADGSMDWATARAWMDAMNAAHYLGYSDWRLPHIEPIDSEYDFSFSVDGSTDYGMGIVSPNSELAYMFSVSLRNYDQLLDDYKDPRDESRFKNLECVDTRAFCPTFWSSNPYVNPAHPEWPQAVWVFDMSIGVQSGDFVDKHYYVWPVRDGNSSPAAVRRN